MGVTSTSVLEGDDLASIPTSELISTCLGKFLSEHLTNLDARGVSRVTFAVVPTSKADEEVPCWFFTYRKRLSYREDKLVRNIEAPLAFQLDLRKLANFNVALVPGKDRGPKLSSVHVYKAYPKHSNGSKTRPQGKRYFVRGLLRKLDKVEQVENIYDTFPGPERVLVHALNALERCVEADQAESKRTAINQNHIYLNIIDDAYVDTSFIEGIVKNLYRRYARRLERARVSEFELRVNVRCSPDAPCTPVRVVASNPTGFALRIEPYIEVTDELSTESGKSIYYSISAGDGGLGGAMAAMGLGDSITQDAGPFDELRYSSAALEDGGALGPLHGFDVTTHTR